MGETQIIAPLSQFFSCGMT